MNTKSLLFISVVLFLTACATQEQTASNTPSIKLGAILPLTGSNALYGLEIQNAIELAREEINTAGGMNGRMLAVIYEDDQSDPKTGVTAAQKLISVDGVKAILGPWVSGVVIAVAPVVEQNKVILLAEGISPRISQAGDYVFRTQPSAVLYAQQAVPYVRAKGYGKLAVLYANNEFGVAYTDAFVQAFVSQGGQVVAKELYDKDVQDFRTQLIKIKETQPDLVLVVGYQETVAIIQQARQIGITTQLIASPPFENPNWIKQLGSLAEEVIYPYHFADDTPAAQRYLAKYTARYNANSQGFGPLLYDGTYIIANALKICGEQTDCIKQALYATNYSGVVGTITFDSNGDPLLPIVMKTVRDGRFVRVT